MSRTVKIESPSEFQVVLQSSKIVVADCESRSSAPPIVIRPLCVELCASGAQVACTARRSHANGVATLLVYADWCGPCNQIAPIYEELSASLSRENVLTFVKVNTDAQKDIAAAYAVTSLPTFIIFRDGTILDRVQGADPRKLQGILRKLAAEVQNVSGGEGSAFGGGVKLWLGAELPRGYSDITSQIELQRSELLNVDTGAGNIGSLFDGAKPSALNSSAPASSATEATRDWIETDTDEQLLLFMPFQSMLKLHTLQVGSVRIPLS